MSHATWKLDGHVAQLKLDALCATVDLRDPEDGLQEPRLGSQLLSGHLLGVLLKPHVESRPADAYIRGNDLVATYAESAQRAMRVQVYWRCQSQIDWLSIDLQVSVQTDCLGVATPVVACSQLELVEALRLVDAPTARYGSVALGANAQQLTPQDGAGCLILRLPDSEWSYAEMIHSADFQQGQFSLVDSAAGNRRACLEHRLFPGTLEKGVILRARIRGLFVARDDDCRRVADDYQQFLRSPLPLTT
jgi:hypothetical protein